MTDLQLQKLVEQLSEKYFGKPFLHKAYFNSRLRTTGGRYLLHSHNIELNKKSYEKFGLKELEGIILHELCHYHLHIEGKGYKHRDKDFRELLKKVGAPRFCSTIEEKKNNTIYVYMCKKCNLKYYRRRKLNLSKCCCGKCYGRLKLVESSTLKNLK